MLLSYHVKMIDDNYNKKLYKTILNKLSLYFIKGWSDWSNRMAKSFTFKQFHIDAFQCGMPVSTDAIILGAWADIEASSTLLDLGCGTGVLALMCAQRNPIVKIKAIEIEKNAVDAARKNIANSPWRDRVSVLHQSIQSMTEDYLERGLKVEAIICNPPYFNDGISSQEESRAIARHSETLPHNVLLNCCSHLLKDEGKASFILPKKEGEAFIKLLSKPTTSLFSLTRLTSVRTTAKKDVTRVLIELTKNNQQDVYQHNELIIHHGEEYSADFIALTKAFYLKM